ncbi:DUF7522 family protein [Halegenticoccus tardaugens]|uniref:DUF7522 family protein n=1 Tax=Halegenticoccus tardaugens TaxID=2071624 RepID=UPI00100AFD69|nr:hypothetical protein [Halegenticoccus tardaugens]
MVASTTDAFADSIVSTCRTAIGDSLRSVIYFTPEEFDLLYLRRDLYLDGAERAREVKSVFVENERLGFSSRETYSQLSMEPDTEPEIGEYEFTIRVFSDGFVNRVIVGDHGVILTTDGLDIDGFEDLAITLRKLLAEG